MNEKTNGRHAPCMLAVIGIVALSFAVIAARETSHQFDLEEKQREHFADSAELQRDLEEKCRRRLSRCDCDQRGESIEL